MQPIRRSIPAARANCDSGGMDTTTHPTSGATNTAATAGGTLPATLRLGPTRLVVTDLERSVDFYDRVIGLRPLGEPTEGVAQVGTADGTVVLELQEQPGARRAGRHAGLYHVALLFPDRRELARAVNRIATTRTMIQGASDHGTHEAIYLGDPDGNGLELAADRPRDVWPNLGDIEEIRPRPLDVHDLLATVEGEEPARFAADGTAVGHLHLHVGDVERALAFYTGVVGFEPITTMDVAAFVSAGGYHHHLAFNTWQGVGAAPAPANTVGLAFWTAYVPAVSDLDALQGRLRAGGAGYRREGDEGISLVDPWGHELRVEIDPAAAR